MTDLELSGPNLSKNPDIKTETSKQGFQIIEATVHKDELLGYSFKILRAILPDGKEITLPIISDIENSNEIRDSVDGQDHQTNEMEITETNRSRFNYCIQTLKLPPLIATRIAFDRLDIDLSPEKFPIPDSQMPQTKIIGVRSIFGRSGKSLLCAIMELQGIRTYSLDVFTGIGPSLYHDIFKSKKFDRNTPIHELMTEIKDIRKDGKGEKRPQAPKNVPSLDVLLDKITDDFISSSIRPSYILLEGTAITIHKDLSVSPFEIATKSSCDAYVWLDQPQFGTDPWVNKNTNKTIYPLNINLENFAIPNEVEEKLQFLANKTRTDIPTPSL